MTKTRKKQWYTKRSVIVTVVAAQFIAIAGLLAGLVVPPMLAKQRIDTAGYQAVFLLNDQAYFGKLTITKDAYVLKNPYVIQNVPVEEGAATEPKAPSFNLQKVTNTVYGPKDSMEINKDQVLFWQNLSDDGKVAKAIRDNQ